MTASASGRPIRFFTGLMLSWVLVRLASPGTGIFPIEPTPAPAASRPVLTSAIVPPARADAAQPTRYVAPPHAPPPPPIFGAGVGAPASKYAPLPPTRPPTSPDDSMPVDLMEFITFTVAFANRHYASDPAYRAAPASPQPSPLLLAPAPSPDRWRASAWLLWRPGSAPTDAVTVGRLGGSQAGLRVDFDMTPHAPARTAAYARLSSALQRPAAPEAALGVAFQPSRTVPVSIAAERRIALGAGGRNANTLMVVGGFGPSRIAPSLEAEAYAQAGMVGFRSRDKFIDGKLSLLSPLNGFRLGGSLSGGAQPQVQRLDIGPEIQFRLPIRPVGARIGLEWRQRIAGNAAPASGLALTLAADF